MYSNAKLAGVRPDLASSNKTNESAVASKVSNDHCVQKDEKILRTEAGRKHRPFPAAESW